MVVESVRNIAKFSKSHHVLAPDRINHEVREDALHHMLVILNKSFFSLKGNIDNASKCEEHDEELQQNIPQVNDCSES